PYQTALGAFPTRRSSDLMGLAAWLQATTLPMLVLVLVTVAQIMRMTRTTVLAVMDQPSIETACLKGLPMGRVVLVHAVPNALGPDRKSTRLNSSHVKISY